MVVNDLFVLFVGNLRIVDATNSPHGGINLFVHFLQDFIFIFLRFLSYPTDMRLQQIKGFLALLVIIDCDMRFDLIKD